MGEIQSLTRVIISENTNHFYPVSRHQPPLKRHISIFSSAKLSLLEFSRPTETWPSYARKYARSYARTHWRMHERTPKFRPAPYFTHPVPPYRPRRNRHRRRPVPQGRRRRQWRRLLQRRRRRRHLAVRRPWPFPASFSASRPKNGRQKRRHHPRSPVEAAATTKWEIWGRRARRKIWLVV